MSLVAPFHDRNEKNKIILNLNLNKMHMIQKIEFQSRARARGQDPSQWAFQDSMRAAFEHSRRTAFEHVQCGGVLNEIAVPELAIRRPSSLR